MPVDRIDLVINFLSEKLGEKIEILSKNISPRISLSLDSDIEEKLRQYLVKDLAIYNFVNEHGKYNKALHSDTLYATLQACR